MQTRLEFEAACRSLIAKYGSATPSLSNRSMRGWSWNESSVISGLGYLSRSTTLSMKSIPSSNESHASDSDFEVEEDMEETNLDAATLTSSPQSELACRQYVVFSATFQVPCLYFTISHSNGTPLSADEVVRTSLFHADAFESTTTTPFAVTRSDSLFPLLSQGDHPTLGTPCWYLHPCETAKAMEELFEEGYKGKEELLRWLEIWFLVAGTVVDLRA